MRPLLGSAPEHVAEPVEERERRGAHLLDVAPVALAALHELAHGAERVGGARAALAPTISSSRPSRSPKALTVTLRASTRLSSSAVTASPARMMSARWGLSPGTVRRCSGDRVQSHSSSCSTSAVVTTVAVDRFDRVRPGAPAPCGARLVKVPPEPMTVTLFHSRQRPAFLSRFRILARSAATSLRAGAALEEILLGEPHGAERQREPSAPPGR